MSRWAARWFVDQTVSPRLVAAYACSGLAGLIYQIAWTRLLTLQLGHTTAAVSTVTAAFMGGLGLGAFVGGGLASRLSPRQALVMYAALEFSVVVAALLVGYVLAILGPFLAWAYGETGGGLIFPFARVASAFAIVFVPAVALGATFPTIVRVVVDTRLGHTTAGHLYAANTAGAAIGAVAAGFLLIPAVGVRGATLAGVLASSVSIALAASLVRDRRPDPAIAAPPAAADATERATNRPRWASTPRAAGREASGATAADVRGHARSAALALASTGAAAFSLEVIWSRVLALVLGPSTYAFSTTLASFIAGLAVGAFAGAALVTRCRPGAALAATMTTTAATVWVTAALVGGPLLGLATGPDAVTDTASGPGFLAVPHLGLAFALTWPIGVGLGITFPLALALAHRGGTLSPRRLGALYAVNTVGSITGSLLAGFVLIPTVGLRVGLLVAAGALLAGAAAVAMSGGLSRLARATVLASIAAVAVGMGMSPRWDHERLASGGYLYARFVPAGVDHGTALTAGSLLYYREGAAGTVSVRRLTGTRSLVIDGKVDASTGRDMLTQKLLGHLPLLLHPDPKDVAIVGLGSGVTLASALTHPVTSVDVIEISPEVVDASAAFLDENRRALENPRTRLIVGDGRSHLSLSSRRYDVVVSEPSNPWMAGVAALFTEEFFLAVRARLRPGGVFCQWTHTYGISATDLRSIVATFRAVFPDGTMWLVGDGDLLLLGSRQVLDARLEGVGGAWRRPGVAEDLRGVAVHEPFSLLSLYVGGPSEMARYAGDAPRQTDDRLALEFSGPYAALAGAPESHASALRALLDQERRPASIGGLYRHATAAEWRNRGTMLLGAEAFDEASRSFVEAIRLDPADVEAGHGLVRAAVAGGGAAGAEAILRGLTASARAATGTRVALARLLGATGRLDEATIIATEATGAAPDDATTWEQLAALYVDRGDVAGLETVAETMRRDFAGHAATWYFAASARFLREEVRSALPLVRRAIALDAAYADAHNLLGVLQAASGDLASAREAFRTSLRLDPRDAVTYANLAQLELSAGAPAVAADLFAEALTLDPTSAIAREGLALARRP